MPRGRLDLVARHLSRFGGPPADNFSDAALLERFVAGREEAAFAALVRRHGGLVWAVCRRVLRCREDAEDAFQATFLVLARRAGSIRRGAAVASWLYGVAYRTALRARRSADRRREGERHVAARAPEQPVTEAALRELQALLDEEVSRLPEKYRAPFVLCCLEGKGRAEAARALGWKEGTVAGRVAQARERLRQRLARRGVALTAVLCATAVAGDGEAAVPAGLAAGVARGAAAWAAGEGAGGVSAGAAGLAEGVFRSMVATRWKAGVALLLALGMLSAGATFAARQVLLGQAPPAPPGEPAAPAEAGPRPRTDRYGDPLPEGAVARLGTMRLRHGDMVRNLGFSADGKVLLSADWHGVSRWDAATGRLLGRFGDPRGRQFQSIAFSADARTAILTMDEGDVDVWDAAAGQRVLRFRVQRFPLVVLSPDGKALAVHDQDAQDRPSLRLHDATTGKELHSLAGHRDTVHHFVFSGDSQTLVSAGDDRAIRFWDVATGRQVRRLDAAEAIGHLALLPGGRTLASVAVTKGESTSGGSRVTFWRQGEEIVLWDLATGKEAHRLKGHGQNGVAAMAFAPDGRTLVSSDWQTTHWWDVASGKERVAWRFPAGRVVTMAFAPDGRTLATGGSDQVVRLWDVATRTEKPRPAGHRDAVHAVAVSPDGRTWATGCGDSIIRLWDARTGRPGRELVGHASGIASLVFVGDGRALLSTGFDKTVRLWDLTSGKERRRFSGEVGILSPDGTLLVTAEERTLYVFDLATGTERRRWPAPKGGAMPLALLPDGRTVCTWGEDHLVRLWDTTTGRELRHFAGHHFAEDGLDRVYCVAVSPDGRYVAFGGQVNAVVLYDLVTGEEVRRLTGLPGAVSALAFAPDSRTLATGDWTGGTVRLWEVATGREFRRLAGHQGRAFQMAFAADSSLLLTGNEDTTALAWDLAGLPARDTLSPRDLEARWTDLAGEHAARAREAIHALASAPNQAVPFLGKRLRPVPHLDADRVPRLLADLDSDNFADRDRATAELARCAEAAEMALRRAAAQSPSAEARARVKQVLPRLEPSGERLRTLRAVQVLERAGTPEARRVLEAVAGGAPDARLTEEAKASLQRLRRRRPE
jgi:RNA polymerase sigma factor (sigma-70 family)